MIRIAELKKERGLSQREAAKIIGVSQGTFNNWENANTQPSIEQLISVARYFEVSVDYLIGNADYAGVINMVSDLSSDQKELISLYSTLSDSSRNAVLAIARAVSKHKIDAYAHS